MFGVGTRTIALNDISLVDITFCLLNSFRIASFGALFPEQRLNYTADSCRRPSLSVPHEIHRGDSCAVGLDNGNGLEYLKATAHSSAVNNNFVEVGWKLL